MLKVLRHKNVTKVVLWGLLILILPAFVLWGTGAGGRSKQGGPTFVGMVNNKKITFNDFAQSLSAIRCQIILNYFNQPRVMDTLLNSKAFLGKLAWDRLLMAEEARKANIKISNDEIVAFLKSHPLFSRNGSFDDRLYSYILKNNFGLEPRTFEEIVRSNLAIQRLNNKMTQDIKVTDEEVIESYGLDNNKFRISYLVFPAAKYTDRVSVDDAEVRDYFEAHKNEFVSPVKINEKEDAAAGAAPLFDDLKGKIKSFLSENKARDIAIKDADDQYKKLKDIMAKDGIDFASAAAKLGMKPGESAFFSRGEYVEGVGEAGGIIEEISTLKPDAVSKVVEMKNGAVIFVVTATQKFDKEKFNKEIDDYSKKALEIKKARYLEKWLRSLEESNKLNIDFRDYEKYYR